MTKTTNPTSFQNVYYRSLLPLEQLKEFEDEEAVQLLTSILNITITTALLKHFSSIEEQKEFLRLCQDDFSDEKILDYLIDLFPGSQQIISETIDRTILAIKR